MCEGGGVPKLSPGGLSPSDLAHPYPKESWWALPKFIFFSFELFLPILSNTRRIGSQLGIISFLEFVSWFGYALISESVWEYTPYDRDAFLFITGLLGRLCLWMNIRARPSVERICICVSRILILLVPKRTSECQHNLRNCLISR